MWKRFVFMLSLSQPDSCAQTAAKTPEREAIAPPSATPPRAVTWKAVGRGARGETGRAASAEINGKRREWRRRECKRALGVNKIVWPVTTWQQTEAVSWMQTCASSCNIWAWLGLYAACLHVQSAARASLYISACCTWLWIDIKN